ncbi:MAG: endonuclease/exonuclease/phosphatase family protein [Pseudomonadota bacterium]
MLLFRRPILQITYAAIFLVLAMGFSSASADEGKIARDLEACLEGLEHPGGTLALESPRDFRVTSWNAMKFLLEGSQRIAGELATDADILFLQESIREELPTLSPLPESLFADGFKQDETQTGVEIRSAHRPDLRCTLRYTEPWLRTPKAVAVARFAMGAESLLAINLHGINFTLGSAAYRAQLADVGLLIDAHAGPVIVGGDMNDWNNWRGTVVAQFVEKHALERVVFRPDWRSRHLGRPVDGFYVRDLDWLDATALPTQSSDHHPITLILRLREPRGGLRASGPASGP